MLPNSRFSHSSSSIYDDDDDDDDGAKWDGEVNDGNDICLNSELDKAILAFVNGRVEAGPLPDQAQDGGEDRADRSVEMVGAEKPSQDIQDVTCIVDKQSEGEAKEVGEVSVKGEKEGTSLGVDLVDDAVEKGVLAGTDKGTSI